MAKEKKPITKYETDKFLKEIFDKAFSKFLDEYKGDNPEREDSKGKATARLIRLREDLSKKKAITGTELFYSVKVLASIHNASKHTGELLEVIRDYIDKLDELFNLGCDMEFNRQVKVQKKAENEPKSDQKQGTIDEKLLGKRNVSITVATILVLVVFTAMLIMNANDGNSGPGGDEKKTARRVNVTVPVNHSFSELLDIKQELSSKEASAIGTLLKETTKTGNITFTKYYVADDYSRRIELRFAGLRNNDRYLNLFDNQTSELYEVSGTLKKQYSTIELIVKDIEPYARQTKLEEVTIWE